MNMISDHDRKLAATLKSLSLEPSLRTPKSPRRRVRRLLLSGWLLALGAGAIFIVAPAWPDVADRFKTALSQQWWTDGISPAKRAVEPSGSRTDQVAAVDNAAATLRKPPPVETREVTGSGYVLAPHVVSVFAKYEGRITAIEVEVGQRVQAGQILVTLDDAATRFALEQAQVDRVTADLLLEARKIELEQANSTFRRSEALAARQSISRQDLENASTARNSAANALAQARQNVVKADLGVRIAQERVDGLVVKAPIAGTITTLAAHVGDMVLARLDSVLENQKLLSITDTTTLVIDADVAETNIGSLSPGLTGEAVLDGISDRPFAIEVLRIAPVASLEKGTVTLRLSLRDPPDGIRPNMAARIRIAQRAGDTSR
ncbi:efflux RND transporter periplasmic adaptor subunit [Jiella pacifica]|uniref:Efflux RND transporter periplasmic adaptor subunit n=1 Tax=Jiella pacifica TaxID=2696469 RepID=A0A6N9T015_9HYPH|nr:efflux RND transporter periplasmic adaptor subunit [Jiella pacifica]NDW04647.1 efflux RND transporter periplasmic adaptor subunit [Jiella pacifica]